jgi:hypothetical protein
MTIVESELSTTYCISSAVNRYDNGTEPRPALRNAWRHVTTSSELGPHHTTRSLGRAPSPSKPFPSRLAITFSSPYDVADGCPPPAASTITADASRWSSAWVVRMSVMAS